MENGNVQTSGVPEKFVPMPRKPYLSDSNPSFRVIASRPARLSELSDHIRPLSQFSFSSDKLRLKLAGSRNSFASSSKGSFNWRHSLRLVGLRSSQATDELHYATLHAASERPVHSTYGDTTSSRLGTTASPKTRRVLARVEYDFHVERADELEARAGQFIILVARADAQWVVAEPIDSPGRPGLIPVSFVEIRDPVTMHPVSTQEALERVDLPWVPEWKRSVAVNKNSAQWFDRALHDIEWKLHGLQAWPTDGRSRITITHSGSLSVLLGTYPCSSLRRLYP